jgi:hypothetical protein
VVFRVDGLLILHVLFSVNSVMSAHTAKTPMWTFLVLLLQACKMSSRNIPLSRQCILFNCWVSHAFLRSTLIRGLVFDRSGFFVNTSRVDPSIFRVDSRQLKIASSGQAAVGIMLGLVTECCLVTECSVTANFTVHKISIAPFVQEMRRDTSLWGQLFGFVSICGPVSEDGLSFSTRAKTFGKADNMPGESLLPNIDLSLKIVVGSSYGSPTTPKKVRSSLLATVRSPMASASRDRAPNHKYNASVPFEEKGALPERLPVSTTDIIFIPVPIYDGRPTQPYPEGFLFTDQHFRDLCKFPLFGKGSRDLPADSLVAVGYTISTYVSERYPDPKLSTNVQFVILLGVGAAGVKS